MACYSIQHSQNQTNILFFSMEYVPTLKAMDALDSIQDTNIEAHNLPFVVHAIAEVVAVSFAVAYDQSNAVEVSVPMVLVWADLNLFVTKMEQTRKNVKANVAIYYL